MWRRAVTSSRPIPPQYLQICREWPPSEMSIVRSHIMWMLGKSGKARHVTFAHTGPFSSAQLRLALLSAETLEEFEDLVRATLCSSE